MPQLFPTLYDLCVTSTSNMADISSNRKEVLHTLASIIKDHADDQQINLQFICTHNSRRSHFAQLAFSLAAEFHHLPNMAFHSAGTEVTAVHQNVLMTLLQAGFALKIHEKKDINSSYRIRWNNTNSESLIFSKKIDYEEVGLDHLINIMVCTDADENCPVLPGSSRIALPYNDPKVYDHSPEALKNYISTFSLILTEALYTFSVCKTM